MPGRVVGSISRARGFWLEKGFRVRYALPGQDPPFFETRRGNKKSIFSTNPTFLFKHVLLPEFEDLFEGLNVSGRYVTLTRAVVRREKENVVGIYIRGKVKKIN